MCFRRVMTDDQRQQFNHFGCVSRCLIRLAEIHGHPISDDKFCSRFRRLFLNPNQYGMLLISQISQVIPHLQLGRHFQVYRRYPAIKYHFEQPRDILVLSEVHLDPGNTNPNDHCSVLRQIDDAAFKLWTPLIDGGFLEPVLPRDLWEEKACTGVVLLH